MNRITSVFVSVVLLGLVCGVAQANLLLNPGYEAPVELAWSPSNESTNWFGWGDVEAVGVGWKTPQSGNQSLVLKNWLGAADGVEQKQTVTAGESYTLSFYSLWDSGYDGSLNTQVRWIDAGGAQIGSNMISWTAGTIDTWNMTSVLVTSMVSSARAEINFGNSGGTAGALYLDTVNFAAIPEPTTAALFGFVALGFLAMRRLKK